MRRLAFVGLISLVLVACGGSSRPSTTVTTFSGSQSSRYCTLARQFSKDVNINAVGDLRAGFMEFDSLVGEFLSVVPAELKADADVLVGAVRQFETALKAADFDFTKVDTNSVKAFDDPKFTAATERLDAYNTQVCGIDSATTTTS